MKVKFYGAAGEVGRSCILIEGNNTKVLFDCGIKLGREEIPDQYPLIDDEELKKIDAIVLSHTHLDHCGYLPHVFSTGWNGYIYATKPTHEIVDILLSDYIRISNPSNVSKDSLKRLKKHCRMVAYRKQFTIKGLRFKLYTAGHVLGSSVVEVTDGRRKLLYTGDMSLRKTRILEPAHTENLQADALIIETTYGGEKDDFQAQRQEEMKKLPASIKETINRGGKIVIPALAVGRGQEVLLMLDDYMRSGLIPKVPIYIDGMISKAMTIHRNNLSFCRRELQNRIRMTRDDPFKSPNFHTVTNKGMRDRIMREQESSIIVTTSGMLNGGPVLRYLEKLAGDEKNKLMFVCYQVEGTLGRQILEGSREIELEGKKYKINMAVEQYRMSGHADRPELLRYIDKVRGLRMVFLVHGEGEKEREMQKAIEKRYKVEIPMLMQEFVL